MPRVKITNLKAGACVINSLKLTIPGGKSVVRDASVVGDPDLSELEAEGIISVTAAEEVKPSVPPKPPAQAAKPQKPTQPPKKGQKGGSQKNTPPPAPQPKPGTSFRIPDGPEDEMGRTVVIMGDAGPEVRKMGPGINGAPGPKYAGDEAADDGKEPEGFENA
jgi:hypothetical protein